MPNVNMSDTPTGSEQTTAAYVLYLVKKDARPSVESDFRRIMFS